MNFRKIFLTLILIFLINDSNSFGFWIWTPETNQWVNPKFSVKDTPAEQLEYAREFFNKEEYDQANQEFNKLIKHYPRAREAAEAQFHLGLILEKQKKLNEAFQAFQEVFEKYPFSERSGEIVDREFEIGNQILNKREKGSRVIAAVIGGRYDVIDIFRTVIKNAPYGPHAAAAQYKIGLFLQGKRLYQEAREEFDKVINDYPESEWARAASYQIALADANRSADAPYDQKVSEAARKEFEDFVKEFPEADLSQEAREQIDELREKEAENQFIVAQFYEKQKKYKAAKIYYNAIVDEYKNSRWAILALKKIQELSFVQ